MPLLMLTRSHSSRTKSNNELKLFKQLWTPSKHGLPSHIVESESNWTVMRKTNNSNCIKNKHRVGLIREICDHNSGRFQNQFSNYFGLFGLFLKHYSDTLFRKSVTRPILVRSISPMGRFFFPDPGFTTPATKFRTRYARA